MVNVMFSSLDYRVVRAKGAIPRHKKVNVLGFVFKSYYIIISEEKKMEKVKITK